MPVYIRIQGSFSLSAAVYGPGPIVQSLVIMRHAIMRISSVSLSPSVAPLFHTHAAIGKEKKEKKAT